MKWLRAIQAKHNLFLKLFLAVLTAMVFTMLLPEKQVSFHRVDEFDAVWPYADLVLEQDFFLQKTHEELDKEQAELESAKTIVFTEDNERKQSVFRKLDGLKLSSAIHSSFKTLLDSIYKAGIVEQSNEVKPEDFVLLEADGGARLVKYASALNVNKAYELIRDYLNENYVHLLRSETIKPEEFIAVTYLYNEAKTNQYRETLQEEISLYKFHLSKGEVLVKRNEALTKSKREWINLYFDQLTEPEGVSNFRFAGRFAIMLMLCLTLLAYLFFFRKQIFAQNIQVFFLYICILVVYVLTAIFFKYGLMLYAIPYLLVPLLVRVFFDSRTALFTHLIAVLTCSLFMPDSYEFFVLQLITGIGVLFSISEMRKRQQVVNAALIACVFYMILFAAYHAGFGSTKLVGKYTAYLPFLISGGLLLLSSPLIFITEKWFGFISDFKLLELCDLNQPLLRRLSQEVPGTFQHSLQVANLAEEAIYFIGGNTLLVRAGAMYHDVGKLVNPGYFIENQGARLSPHIEMMPKESARIIIDHVLSGIELAKNQGLPEQVIDFIRTHHGTTTVHFFLNLHKKEQAQTEVDESEFRYPGPIPFSKETAVLMLADGVEAASRSLKVHDALTINDLVDRVVDYKINQNQLINADITFKDISLIKKIFKKRLMTIYHARIEYPS
jgi:cyclic-di-AMP phosphodiesterase PgpH